MKCSERFTFVMAVPKDKNFNDGPQYCPDEATLKDMHTIAIWGEGVAGCVHLRIKSISAIGCSE
eukprot:7557470-Ditylum_brightwellii.AAC.2